MERTVVQAGWRAAVLGRAEEKVGQGAELGSLYSPPLSLDQIHTGHLTKRLDRNLQLVS